MSLAEKMEFSDYSRPTARSFGALTVKATRLPLLALIYLLCVVLPIGFQVGPLAMTTLRLLLLLVTIPLAVGLFSGRYGKIMVTDILMFVHIIWAAVALAINNPEVVVQQWGSVGIEFIGGYLIGRATIRSREDFSALCRVLIFLVFLTTPFAIFEAQTGRPYILEWIREIPAITSTATVYIEGRLGLERVQANFAHPIHYGLFCSVTFSLTFVALKGLIRDTRRWISSGIILGSGLLALSSGALLAMVLQIGMICWHVAMKSVRGRWWVLFCLFIFSYVVVDVLSNRSPLQVFMSYATFSAHNAYWRSIIFDWGLDNVIGNAAREIPPAPWFGIGLSDWVRPHYMYSSSMDNFWLVIAVRYGLPGFFFLAIGYAIAIFRVMCRKFNGDKVLENFRLAWVFTFAGLTFTLCTVHVWTNIYSFVFFLFGAGIWFITASSESGGGPKQSVERGCKRSSRGQKFTRFGANSIAARNPSEGRR